MSVYSYPASRHRRRHGPAGYADVESFRPWLRDEFTFRCVYCLEREAWSNLVAGFALDHFAPVSVQPEKSLSYDNLLYACRACNAVKRNLRVPDPLKVLLSDAVFVHVNGQMEGRSREARRLIDLMQLNRPAYVKRREMMQRTLATAESHDPLLYRMLLSYPQDLPNLTRLRPPSNSRPKGVDKSYHALRKSGELPEAY